MPTATPMINPTTFAPAKFGDIASILNLIIPLLTLFGGLMFLAMLILGALTFMTAGGNAEKAKKAQSILMFAIIGLIVVISAYMIVKLVGVVFNINTFI